MQESQFLLSAFLPLISAVSYVLRRAHWVLFFVLLFSDFHSL